MRRRAMLLVMTIGMVLAAVACGRASQHQIDQALGITPTATLSPGDLATSTARALAQASAAVNASPGSVAALGNVTQGRSTFQFNCAQCHRADGSGRGPSLEGPNSPEIALSDDQIKDLIRNGTNHSPPNGPGPYQPFKINDARIADIIAYLRSISG
jgi:mono/diheme cytochrome c family protein